MPVKMVILERIENGQAVINDYKTNEKFEVPLRKEEIEIYQSMLDEGETEELETEETGVFVFYNDKTKSLDFTEKESE